jgi:hypothetical protein
MQEWSTVTPSFFQERFLLFHFSRQKIQPRHDELKEFQFPSSPHLAHSSFIGNRHTVNESHHQKASIHLNIVFGFLPVTSLPFLTMIKSTLLLVILSLGLSFAFFPRSVPRNINHKRTSLTAALPDGYQEFGEHIIQKAGESCGIQKKEELDIEWKAGRIVVTVRGSVYVSNPDDTSEEEEGENGNETREVSGVDITLLWVKMRLGMQ